MAVMPAPMMLSERWKRVSESAIPRTPLAASRRMSPRGACPPSGMRRTTRSSRKTTLETPTRKKFSAKGATLSPERLKRITAKPQTTAAARAKNSPILPSRESG